MRDARILPWLLADPARATQLRADQLAAVRTIAAAEGLADVLEARLAGAELPIIAADPVVALCDASARLLGGSDLGEGLCQLWDIHALIVQGQKQPDFWPDVRDCARAQSVTAHVSRALRLCHHLFETPVDAYLAWQGQRSDIFFIGRLLARNGKGEETARILRGAFKLRARWRMRRR